MKKLFFAIIIAATVLNASAQKASIAVGCKKDNTGKMLVQIKFLFPDKVVSDKQINIFRKALPTGAWEKVNNAPITKATLSESYADDDYKTYKGYMNRKTAANAEDENNAQAMAGLYILDNNKFAQYAGCYFEDKSVEEGKTYQYKISDANSGDKELAQSVAIEVKTNYLPTMSKLTATQKKQDVLFFWDEQAAFFAYNVYRKSNPNDKGTLLTPDGLLIGIEDNNAGRKAAENIRYIDSNLSVGVVYYEYTGIDVLGNESAPSIAVRVEIKDMTPPKPTKNVQAKREGKDAIITWDAVKDKDLKGYNILRNNSKDSAFKKINSSPISVATFTDKNLAEGDVYGYKIESTDEAENTSQSRHTVVFFPDQSPPAKPTGLKAVSAAGTVQLTWNNNKENDLKGYYLYRASNRDKDYFNMLYRYPIVVNSFNDTLPSVAKNEFVYYIQAVDEDYNVSLPSDTVIITLPDTVAPLQPIIRNIKQEKDAILFDADLRDDDKDIVGYTVFRSNENNDDYQRINREPITEKTFKDPINPSAQSYFYYIVSIDASGNESPKSDKANLYIFEEEKPMIAANNLKATYDIRDSSINISWSNEAKNVNGYLVYRKSGEEPFKPISEVISAANFADKEVEYGIEYQYLVRTLFKESTTTSSSVSITQKAE